MVNRIIDQSKLNELMSDGWSYRIYSGSGSGSIPSVPPKDVNFYDYDGTLLYAYTLEEARALTELPAGPKRKGLIFKGWNWSLENVKALTYPMNVGATYSTDDGTTRLYVSLKDGRTSPYMVVYVTGTLSVDWGDGTDPDVSEYSRTQTVVKLTHSYASPGDYVIKLSVDGSMEFRGSVGTNEYGYILRNSNSADIANAAYRDSVTRVEFGDGVKTIDNYSFYYMRSLESILIPADSTPSIGNDAFAYGCLSFIVLPRGTYTVGERIVGWCNCRGFSLPDDATTVPYGFMYGNYVAERVDIPPSVTTIKSRAFYDSEKFTFVYIPSNVNSIEDRAFFNCKSLVFIDFSMHTSVPTLGSNVFYGVPADFQIRVPAALYDEWSAATNWFSYASQIVAV